MGRALMTTDQDHPGGESMSATHSPFTNRTLVASWAAFAALNVALAATLRPGERVVVHAPIWPNIPNVVRLRGAELDTIASAIRGAQAGASS